MLTTSLGLGSGDWLPGLDLHLNSMLGEADLIRGPLEAGARMESMMAPSLVARRERARARDRRRRRHAPPHRARHASRPGSSTRASLRRTPSTGRASIPPDGVVNAEPGADEDGLRVLEASGRTVRRWPERHHYFGGVSAIGTTGAAADPRRSGAARAPRPAG